MPELTYTEDETIYWIDPANGDIWERTGGCSQCGDCCYDDPVDHLFKNQDGNWVQGQGIEQIVHSKCAYFRWAEDGKASCVGRDTTYYLTGCNSWPNKPNQITDYTNCTYTFTKIN